MAIENETPFFEKIMGVEIAPMPQEEHEALPSNVSSLGPRPLNEGVSDADKKTLNEALEEMRVALEEGRLVDFAVWLEKVGGVIRHPIRSFRQWKHKLATPEERASFNWREGTFISEEAARALTGKTLVDASEYLEVQLAKVRDWDPSILITPGVEKAVGKVREEVKGLETKIKKVRQGFGQLEQVKRAMDEWYQGTLKDIAAKNKQLMTVLGDVLGGVEFDQKGSYEEVPDFLKPSLDYALTMRQATVNMITYKLPCGCDNLFGAPELIGVGGKAEDETRQVTNKMWMGIMDEVVEKIPIKYGGNLVPKHIRAHGVSVVVKELGEMGRLKLQFDGDYTILFHKTSGGPEKVTARLRISDDVSVESLGSTSHLPRIEKVSFSALKKELGVR